MKNSILFCFLFLGLNSITAQGIGNLLLAGEDASLLTENYLSPAASGLMSGMNSGWWIERRGHGNRGRFDRRGHSKFRRRGGVGIRFRKSK